MTLKAIVFDFDGTLLESADIKTDAFASLFRSFPEHLDEILDYHLAHAGISRCVKFRTIYQDILRLPLTVSEEQRLALSFKQQVMRKLATCAFVPGAEEFLVKRSAAYRCFVASGTPEEELHEVVRQRGLERYFQGVYGSPATKSEIIRRIRIECGLAATEMMCIGDALSDLESAESEGIPFVGRVRDGRGVPFPPGKTVMTFQNYSQLDSKWGTLLARLGYRQTG